MSNLSSSATNKKIETTDFVTEDNTNEIVYATDENFNLNDIKADEDSFEESEEISVSNIIQKPKKQTFIFIHPDKKLILPVYGIKDEETGNFYIISKKILDLKLVEVIDSIATYKLFLYADKWNEWFFWPIKVPYNQFDKFNETALRIAKSNFGKWITVYTKGKKYVFRPSEAKIPQPEPFWPEDFDKFVSEKLKYEIINEENHPFLKQLRGE